MATTTSSKNIKYITTECNIEDLLGYELALHIYRMLEVEELAQDLSVDKAASELSNVLDERWASLKIAQSSSTLADIETGVEAAIEYQRSLSGENEPKIEVRSLKDLMNELDAGSEPRLGAVERLNRLFAKENIVGANKAQPVKKDTREGKDSSQRNTYDLTAADQAGRKYLRDNFNGTVKITHPESLSYQQGAQITLNINGSMKGEKLPYLINGKDAQFSLLQLLNYCAARLVASTDVITIQPTDTKWGNANESGDILNYEVLWHVTPQVQGPETLCANISILSEKSRETLTQLMAGEGFNEDNALGPRFHIDIITPVTEKKSFRFYVPIAVAVALAAVGWYLGK